MFTAVHIERCICWPGHRKGRTQRANNKEKADNNETDKEIRDQVSTPPGKYQKWRDRHLLDCSAVTRAPVRY